MPRGDKTGPEGMGPLTGRQMGYCAGNNSPGFTENERIRGRGFGRGLRFGWGNGRGFGRGRRYQWEYSEDMLRVSEKTLIENEIRVLKDQLSFLEEQLSKTKEE